MRLLLTHFCALVITLSGFAWAHDGAVTQAESTAVSTTAMHCATQPGRPHSCTPIFACIGEKGEFFQGQARGWGELGLLRGRTGSGAHCSGFWQRDGEVGVGKAKINCSNGTRAEVNWNARHREAGYFVGSGSDSENRKVLAWTGRDIIARISAEGLGFDVFCSSRAQDFGRRLDALDG
ncbi:hypothetical protein TRM7557_02672 [Tritonibacter multivorans]|uniref:Uncharacterized protein n=2 Tax=Tritonibacter multivorans TaxID=928856 RepID=A0A0P1GEY6_9RHOB|nr:hypothetical protein TRM7557_02672 [Tritonibacter multivorans]SFB98436.1 hypothetical protein SAMN04488049_10146 [Tritonibacter multivorans]